MPRMSFIRKGKSFENLSGLLYLGSLSQTHTYTHPSKVELESNNLILSTKGHI